MAIDYDKLLKNPKFRRRVSKEKYAEYLEDECSMDYDIEAGKEVLSLIWEGNSPGSSGACWVREWHGFLFCSSMDFEPEGPFDSLDEVWGLEWFDGETLDPKLYSSELALEDLLDLGMSFVAKNGDVILVNGVSYVRRSGRLVKMRKQP